MALKDIIGQDKALRILFGTLRRNRVPSSILFSGDSGTGKMTAAINYAKTLNCLQPEDFNCCDKCISCRKIDHDNHPDVLIVTLQNMEDKLDLKKRETKDSNRYEIPIEAVRKIEEILSFKPSEGKKKIVIIDDADTMNDHAANAFLKTLEEPPSDSILLLISPNPDALPATIMSRCINVRFYPLSVKHCREVVSKSIDAKDMHSLLHLSMGRPGLILSEDFMKQNERFIKLLDNMLSGAAKDVWANKGEIKSWLDMAFIFLRDKVVYAATNEEHRLILKNQRSMTKSKDIKGILDVYQGMQNIMGLLDFNLNKSITWNYVASIMRTLMAHNS
jgi:DNA polymerase-3 subunit delta'